MMSILNFFLIKCLQQRSSWGLMPSLKRVFWLLQVRILKANKCSLENVYTVKEWMLLSYWFIGDESDDEQSNSPPAAKRPALSSTPDVDDVAGFVGTQIRTADQRYNLLVNHFKPGADYSFPKYANGRSFQLRWLQKHPWLVYSKKENGGFCLPCVLFASSGYHGCDPGVLVNRPSITFSKAIEIFRKHADKQHHKAAVVRCEEFLKTMKSTAKYSKSPQPSQDGHAELPWINKNSHQFSRLLNYVVVGILLYVVTETMPQA